MKVYMLPAHAALETEKQALKPWNEEIGRTQAPERTAKRHICVVERTTNEQPQRDSNPRRYRERVVS